MKKHWYSDVHKMPEDGTGTCRSSGMNQVLLALCRTAVFLTSANVLLTSRHLVAATGKTRNEVIRILHDLKERGFVHFSRTSVYDTWEERNVFRQGWEITDKAYGTAEFDVALDVEAMWLSHFANGELEADPFMSSAHYRDIRYFLDPRRDQ